MTTSPTHTHFVKVRQKGKKQYSFLTPRGGTNRLRVHAAQFTEENANNVVKDIHEENEDWEAVAVLICKA